MAKTKAYFFQNTVTKDRFLKNDEPSESNFRILFDSIPFKLETSDTASETQQGLVKLVSDANAESRTSAGVGTMMQVVQPHQLPMLLSNATEITKGTHGHYGGVTITGVEVTSGSNKRLSYQVTLDGDSLGALTGIAATDYFIGVKDVGGVKTTCKVLMSEIQAGLIWQRNSTTISPLTDNDDLEIGTGTLHAGGISLSASVGAAYVTIDGTGPTGAHLHVVGGDGSTVGGSVYIYGGHATAEGDTFLAWNGSAAKGFVGIGGAVDNTATYIVKITGKLQVTGGINMSLTVGGDAVGAGYAPLMISDAGSIGSPTFKAFMDAIVGSTLSAKAIIYFNGTSYSSIATGSTADKYLLTGSGGTPSFGDLYLDGKIDNDSFSADGVIALARLVPLTANMMLATDANGVLTSSGIAPSALTYAASLTADAQTQIDTLKAVSGSNGIYFTSADYTILAASLYSTIVADCTLNTVDITLPPLADVPDGTTIEVIKKFTAGSYHTHVVAHSGDAVNSLGMVEVTSVEMAGATGTVTRYKKYNDSVWHQVA